MSSVSDVNSIIESAILEGFSESLRSPFRSFGIGKSGISFQGAGARTFEIAVTQMFEGNAELCRTVTKKRFEKLLLKAFWGHISEKRQADGKDVAEFFKRVLAERCQSFSVFRGIHGIRIMDESAPIILGPYTVYRFETHKSIIEARAGGSGADLLTMEFPAYLAEVVVNARHAEKAIDLADDRFKQLDSTLRFVVGGRNGNWAGGVSGTPGLRRRETFVFAEDGEVTANYGTEGSPLELQLDDPYFDQKFMWHAEIWKYLSSETLNEMQQRIVSAVTWLGEAYGESSRQMAFLKAAIALEVIFTSNARGIITASILHNLSESVALLLGKGVSDRIAIESRVKDLYAQRSSIAHSGGSDIGEADLQDVLYYTHEVLRSFLGRESLRALAKGSALHDMLKKARYSCAEI